MKGKEPKDLSMFFETSTSIGVYHNLSVAYFCFLQQPELPDRDPKSESWLAGDKPCMCMPELEGSVATHDANAKPISS